MDGDRWLVVGAGRCGLQLARAMAAAGRPPVAVATRSASSRRRARRCLPGIPVLPLGRPLPAVSALLVAVSDSALADCAAALATAPPPGCRVAMHTSGLHPGAALTALRKTAIALGSFHPLLPFSSPDGELVRTAGASAAIEGQRRALAAARRLARTLGMRARVVGAADKPLYHAAAALAANLTHALVVAAREQLEAVGFGKREAADALARLVRTTLTEAIAARGWERLTGPLVRGDSGTVRAHLAALPEELADVYRAVALVAIDRLCENGLESAPDPIRDALTGPGQCASVREMAKGKDD